MWTTHFYGSFAIIHNDISNDKIEILIERERKNKNQTLSMVMKEENYSFIFKGKLR